MAKAIISRFKEKPKTKLAWRAMWLGLGSILAGPFLGIFAAVIRPAIDGVAGENAGVVVGFGVGIAVIVYSAIVVIVNIKVFCSGERSWVAWLGFVPAMILAAFWIFMIAGELFFPH